MSEPIGLLVFAVAFITWLVTSVRPADDHQVAALATMYRVPLNEGVVVRLRHRVLTLRRWRRFGAFAGVGVTGLVAAVTPIDLAINALLFGAAIGYGVASVIGELWTTRRRTPGDIASPRRRGLTSLIGIWVALPTLTTIALAIGALAVNWIWRPGDGGVSLRDARSLSDASLVASTIGLVVVLVVSVTVLRLVAIAPERGPSVEDHVVQRASRVVAIMTVIGATWMVVGVIGSVPWRPLFDVDIDNGVLSLLRYLAGSYVGLSVLLGFISTVSTLPRNRWFRTRFGRAPDPPLPSMSAKG
ncbi:MAG: hypothetical protein AAGG08_08775 [Actinomycetota bacterium]